VGARPAVDHEHERPPPGGGRRSRAVGSDDRA
jgi:hypothetical protein